MQDRQTLTCPRKADKTFTSNMVRLNILEVLDFSPQTLKSGVLVRSDDSPAGEALLFMRGAPLAIKRTVMGMAASVPANFDEVTRFLRLAKFAINTPVSHSQTMLVGRVRLARFSFAHRTAHHVGMSSYWFCAYVGVAKSKIR